jgi:hypothetical protein
MKDERARPLHNYTYSHSWTYTFSLNILPISKLQFSKWNNRSTVRHSKCGFHTKLLCTFVKQCIMQLISKFAFACNQALCRSRTKENVSSIDRSRTKDSEKGQILSSFHQNLYRQIFYFFVVSHAAERSFQSAKLKYISCIVTSLVRTAVYEIEYMCKCVNFINNFSTYVLCKVLATKFQVRAEFARTAVSSPLLEARLRRCDLHCENM